MLISITGPECSGKTAMTEYLALELHATPVGEYARTYLDRTHGEYTFDDLDVIAQGQLDLVLKAAGIGLESKKDRDIVISDTFLLVIRIWAMYKYGMVSDSLQRLFVKYRPDIYVLCKPDLPWKNDGLREHEFERDALFEKYLAYIKSSGIPFVIVEGLGEERKQKALLQVKTLIQKSLP